MHTALYETDYECEACVEWLLFKKQYYKKQRNLDKFEPIAIKKHLRLSKFTYFAKEKNCFQSKI